MEYIVEYLKRQQKEKVKFERSGCVSLLGLQVESEFSELNNQGQLGRGVESYESQGGVYFV
jgi:hypothetical protein